ncbi:excalibur calcium-binding domain-containing protein [Corynebacterium kefirresidentii]|uniref:excalibur calcium-binding domain-containing protein n=2 Tax=Corynebacterium TaxID=1716 RepID=UPI00223BBA4F|nr:excalibur calcium-binding domain-containing protein [Corynebacterium kefirresidentii]MCT2188937.1 excalibur calcium-binding domain-containing protein [Corynebacterium kefirresidentii]
MKKLLPILVTTTLLISACSDSGESSETTSSTTSSSPSSTTTSSTTSSTSSVTTSSSSEVTPPPEVEEPDEEDEHDDDDLHVHDNPNAALGDSDEEERAKQAPAEKTVSSCGDPSIHERGTTFFSDGTSGWTQQCSDEMAPQVAQQFVAPPAEQQNDPAPAGGGSGRTCAEIGHKVYPGDPDYSPARDANGDGVGCESYPG